MAFSQFNQTVWQWCDMSYARNKSLCLELQDNCQVNVSLLLLAHYLDATLGVIGPRQYAQSQWQLLSQVAGEWDDKFITPYRRLRRLAKNSLSQHEYQQMLDVELMLERKSQRSILNKLNELSPSGQKNNLVSYLAQFGLSAEDIELLELITP